MYSLVLTWRSISNRVTTVNSSNETPLPLSQRSSCIMEQRPLKEAHSSDRNPYSLAHVYLTFVFIVVVQVIVVPVVLGEWRAVETQGEKEGRWGVILACYSPVCSGEVGPHCLPGLHSCTAQSPSCQCDRLPPVVKLRVSSPDIWPDILTSDHSSGFCKLLNSATKALRISQM